MCVQVKCFSFKIISIIIMIMSICKAILVSIHCTLHMLIASHTILLYLCLAFVCAHQIYQLSLRSPHCTEVHEIFFIECLCAFLPGEEGDKLRLVGWLMIPRSLLPNNDFLCIIGGSLMTLVNSTMIGSERYCATIK